MHEIPLTMHAMVLTGHGGLDKYEWFETWKTPKPQEDEVLIKVSACGLNNTDVNTRTGWYSKNVNAPTMDTELGLNIADDPAWGGTPISFPRIQGADVCGYIVEVGQNVSKSRIGQRVITDNWVRDENDPENIEKVGYLGSERDGGFAQYTAIPSKNALEIISNLSDEELATFSCSYTTAEGMLTRANVMDTDTVLVPGASGGVGSALVQLAKRRGARVIAMTTPEKFSLVEDLGADIIISRVSSSWVDEIKSEKISVVADVVGGSLWKELIEILECGGRYTCSGAIAGPIVELDLRTFYLRDLTFTGSTVTETAIAKNIVRYIEDREIKPCLAEVFPLSELKIAQKNFMEKKHVGNIVVVP